MEYVERPEILNGTTYKVRVGCGNLYVTINEDEKGNFFEVFSNLGKSGTCARASTESISKLITLYLRSGGEIQHIVDYIGGIACSSQIFDPNAGRQIVSCSDGVSYVLKKHLESKKKEEVKSGDTKEGL